MQYIIRYGTFGYPVEPGQATCLRSVRWPSRSLGLKALRHALAEFLVVLTAFAEL